MKKVENKLIERDALSNYTVLNEAISDLPEKTKKDLSKALSKDNSNFDWKGVIEKSIKESDDFYIQPINGSSEVSIVLHMSNIKKEVFEKEVSKESASIIGVRKKAKP
jgi:predicted nucleic acid-binding OB-fold protein